MLTGHEITTQKCMKTIPHTVLSVASFGADYSILQTHLIRKERQQLCYNCEVFSTFFKIWTFKVKVSSGFRKSGLFKTQSIAALQVGVGNATSQATQS